LKRNWNLSPKTSTAAHRDVKRILLVEALVIATAEALGLDGGTNADEAFALATRLSVLIQLSRKPRRPTFSGVRFFYRLLPSMLYQIRKRLS
jgi:hypothetical protein